MKKFVIAIFLIVVFATPGVFAQAQSPELDVCYLELLGSSISFYREPDLNSENIFGRPITPNPQLIGVTQQTDEQGFRWWYVSFARAFVREDAVSEIGNCDDLPEHTEETINQITEELLNRLAYPIAENFSDLGVLSNCQVSANGINIRQGPSTNTEVVGQLQDTQKAVYKTRELSGSSRFIWYRLEDGGFVRNDVVTEEGDCEILVSTADIGPLFASLSPHYIQQSAPNADECMLSYTSPWTEFNAPTEYSGRNSWSEVEGEEWAGDAISRIQDVDGMTWWLMLGAPQQNNQWLADSAIDSRSDACDELPIFPDVLELFPATDLVEFSDADFGGRQIVEAQSPDEEDLRGAILSVATADSKPLDTFLSYELSQYVIANLDVLLNDQIVQVDAQAFFARFAAHPEVDLLNPFRDDWWQTTLYIDQLSYIARILYNFRSGQNYWNIYYPEGLAMSLIPEVDDDMLVALTVRIRHQRPREASAYDAPIRGGFAESMIRFERAEDNILRASTMTSERIADLLFTFYELNAWKLEDGVQLEATATESIGSRPVEYDNLRKVDSVTFTPITDEERFQRIPELVNLYIVTASGTE